MGGMTPYYSDDAAPVAYHYSRQGRNTMSYDDGKYAFGVDDFGWDLTPPPEDFGYGLGWAALGAARHVVAIATRKPMRQREPELANALAALAEELDAHDNHYRP